MDKRKFNGRSFTSFIIAFSFVILILTGIVMYIIPAGRVAYWTGWKLLSVSKDGWQTIHTVSALLFAIFGIIHLLTYNWKPFWNYVTSKSKKGLKRPWELILALSLVLVLTVGSALYVPPFKSLMDLGEYFKELWPHNADKPPASHAESMSLREYTQMMEVPYDEAVGKLSNGGIEVENDEITLTEIGHKNGHSPSEIAKIIGGEKKKKGSCDKDNKIKN